MVSIHGLNTNFLASLPPSSSSFYIAIRDVTSKYTKLGIILLAELPIAMKAYSHRLQHKIYKTAWGPQTGECIPSYCGFTVISTQTNQMKVSLAKTIYGAVTPDCNLSSCHVV